MLNYHLKCVDCDQIYNSNSVDYVCPVCSKEQKVGYPLKGILMVDYDVDDDLDFDVEKLKRSRFSGHGRYFYLLPFQKITSLPPLDVGPTPLDPVERLREELGLKNLFIKNDTVLPTGSFKDRASSIVVAKARELGKDVITTASTGNAATALAGMCASVGMRSVIFVPESAPKAKLAQIAMFGAELVLVKGTYDDCVGLCKEAAHKFGWYCRNTGYNPYTIDGKKTAAFEIWEQLGYKVPDKVIVPTGDAVILSGTYKGFYDLKKLGLIEKIPQICPVQASGSAAIVDALEQGLDEVVPLSEAKTIADSISVAAPACGNWALKIVRETGGFGIKVEDAEITSAIKELATLSGIFAEPAAAAAYAGLKKVVSESKVLSDESVVVLITGTGLKDVAAAIQAVDLPEAIEPKIELVISA